MIATSFALFMGLACFPRPCSDLRQVHWANRTGETIDLLFLPDGFTLAEIPKFRCAVRLFLEGLLNEGLLGRFSCSVNAYRIDLVDTVSGTPRSAECNETSANCAELPLDWSEMETLCSGLTTDSPTEMPTWPDCPPSPSSFDTRICTGNVCRLTWPSGDGASDALARGALCVPGGADQVIILANSGSFGGGGAPGLAVVTIDNITNATRWRRLDHELGHAFGLLDEYSSLGAVDYEEGPKYQCGRNVYTTSKEEGTGCPAGDVISWEETCHPPPDSPLSSPCPDSGKCTTVFGPPPCKCGSGSTSQVGVGLWEGAFYHDCDYYRPSATCRMRDASMDFCSVCKGLIEDTAADAGIDPCGIATSQIVIELDQDELGISGCSPEMIRIGEHSWPSFVHCSEQFVDRPRRMWAEVEHKGIRGELPVREMRADLRDRDGKKRAHELRVRRVSGARGDVLQWSWDGEPLPPGGPSRGARVGKLTVVDPFGRSWKANSVRWESVVPKEEP